MFKTYIKYTFFLLLFISVMLSCKVTKRYQQPDVVTGGLYRDHNTTDTTTIAAMPWESLFTDTVLKALIHEGLEQNLNLKTAVQKIVEAQATLGQTKAAFFTLFKRYCYRNAVQNNRPLH